MDVLKFVKFTLIACVSAFCIFLIDRVNLASTKFSREVVEKNYTPAFTTTQVICGSNNVCVPHVVYHPPSWSVIVSIENVSCDVPETHFARLRVGSKVAAKIAEGRLFGSLYCNGLIEVEEGTYDY